MPATEPWLQKRRPSIKYHTYTMICIHLLYSYGKNMRLSREVNAMQNPFLAKGYKSVNLMCVAHFVGDF